MSEPKWWRSSVLDLAELCDIQQKAYAYQKKAYAYQKLYERVVGEREDAQAALDRVEALHRPVVAPAGTWEYCQECSRLMDGSGRGVRRYPCVTILALRGDAS